MKMNEGSGWELSAPSVHAYALHNESNMRGLERSMAQGEFHQLRLRKAESMEYGCQETTMNDVFVVKIQTRSIAHGKLMPQKSPDLTDFPSQCATLARSLRKTLTLIPHI
jgi:hypothetical protein